MRYTPQRKSAFVRDIIEGRTNIVEFAAAHNLSEDELCEWLSAYERGDMRVTKIFKRREKE